MPSLERNPMLRPVASTTSRVEMASPFDSPTIWRSGPVDRAVTLALIKPVWLGIARAPCDQRVVENAARGCQPLLDHTAKARGPAFPVGRRGAENFTGEAGQSQRL